MGKPQITWDPPDVGGLCWVRYRDEWRPGRWLRTVERGRHKSWYVCEIGYRRIQRTIHPDHVKERKSP